MRIGPIPSGAPIEMSQLAKLEELAGASPSAMAAGNAAAAQSIMGTPAPLAPGAALRADFNNFLTKAVSDVEGKMRMSEVEKQKVLSGETNNLHQATIASAEAGVAFSLMMEVRNKLVESYQELMRMQV